MNTLLVECALVSVCASGGGAVANRPAEPGVQDRPSFSTESRLVVLPVTVTDRKGRYLTGLPQDAFHILDNDQPQVLRIFGGEDAPVTVGLLIDSSRSMGANRDLVMTAVTAFVESSHPQDEIFALAFNDSVQSALPVDTPFTNDPAVLQSALADAIATHGRTAFNDAVAAGLTYAGRGRHERKVLVMVSDGGDNASETRYDDILMRARASNVVIYGVGIIDSHDQDARPRRLRQLAEATGGEAFLPRDKRQVITVLEHIATDIRHAYVLAYEPVDRTLGFHRIRIDVTVPGGEASHVRTRAGYAFHR